MGAGEGNHKRELGALLRRLRRQRAYTQLRLADELGINYRHYQDIEGGKSDVKVKTLCHIVRFYGIDLVDLLKSAISDTGAQDCL